MSSFQFQKKKNAPAVQHHFEGYLNSRNDLSSFANTAPYTPPAIIHADLCPCDGGCPECAHAIQPKLKIGSPNGKYEQEADRIADEVMRMPEPAVQCKPT